MPDRISRRRILSAAGALGVGGAFAASGSRWPLRGQPTDRIGAVARLFAADRLDPNWFSPDLLAQVSPAQLQQAVTGLKGLFGAFELATTPGDPMYVARFSGGAVELRVGFDDQLRIAAFVVAGLSYALAADEQEIAFTSGNDTLYGTLLLPQGISAPPAALLIAGSGPTDRNGNSPLLGLQVNTLASLARALAAAGIASLRYDKLGAGKTGRAGHTAADVPTFAIYLDEALAAFAALRARPEVDPTRTLVVGHSEGGLFAELLALQEPLNGLILAAPLGTPILDTLRRQLIAQGDQALAAGQFTQAQYDRISADLDATIAGIRRDGAVPAGVFADAPAVLTEVFGPGITPYLQQEDRYDPAQLAAQLPAALATLVLHGDLDTNVIEPELQHLLSGFQAAGAMSVQFVQCSNVDHELRQAPLGQAPDLTRSYPFSLAVADAVTQFAAMVFP